MHAVRKIHFPILDFPKTWALQRITKNYAGTWWYKEEGMHSSKCTKGQLVQTAFWAYCYSSHYKFVSFHYKIWSTNYARKNAKVIAKNELITVTMSVKVKDEASHMVWSTRGRLVLTTNILSLGSRVRYYISKLSSVQTKSVEMNECLSQSRLG